MKTFLKLHPHKHTGKLLHHRHTSYPALFLLLALVGAVLLTPVGLAKADNLFVTAVVPAPLPSDPAVITSPADGSVVNQPNIVVSGNCPIVDPPIIVVLYDGSNIIGSAYCASDGSFSIPVSLTPGSHSIVPQIVNFTGQNGPSGRPILIIYDPDAVTTQTITLTETVAAGPAQKPVTGGDPLELLTDSPYILYGPKKDAVWNGSVRGGNPPYGITLNWGDGTIATQHDRTAGSLSLKHHYKQQKMYKLRIEARDTKGNVLGVNVVAVSPAAYVTTPEVVGNTNLPQNWLLYTLYILMVLGLITLWRQERLHYAHQPVPIVVDKRRRTAARTRKR